MLSIFSFFAGAAAGAVAYRFFYMERYKRQELCCNAAEKERQLQQQLERLISYSGRKED